jgi:hypothetical protein
MASKKRAASNRSLNPSIAINGKSLADVRTRLHHSYDTGAVSYTMRPAEHHRLTQDEDMLILQIPLITAVQLYHDGVLPVDRSRSVEITVDGKNVGAFRLEWLRKPADSHDDRFGESILLRFDKAEQTHQLPADLNVEATTITPLKLEPRGMWDPAEEYWGEEGEPVEEWAKAIITKGPRPLFEMEQILPGLDPEDFDSDPIIQANELRAHGLTKQARELLSNLIDQDVRCLDAHAHLGSMEFDRKPAKAIAHYQRGVEIGRLSLGKDFSGVLPWGMIDNRPFLRCLHGFGLCLWRLGRFEEAERIFDELLWLAPSDNLGVRFVLPRVRARLKWTPDE